ncbi:ATP-dependent helicase [Spirochaetia bacterium]|nr:ATP-dependent helicase [Spirochaetia bacterium]
MSYKEEASGGKESDSFLRLDERIQKWIYRNEWTEFRDIQEKAIPLLLENTADVILASSTSSGKTEAAFFPILTNVLQDISSGAKPVVIYISPLTALINDQYFRITELCAILGISVHPWHGGVTARVKKDFIENPQGILLITPESLQGLFCNHGFEIVKMFSETRYIIIDEIHSFLGSERGRQLQSIMHILELRVKKQIQRVGLSATLGDMEMAISFLTGENPARECKIIVANEKKLNIKLLIKGIRENKDVHVFENTHTENGVNGEESPKDETFAGAHEITDYLFVKLRGSNNLVFPNTRSKVEYYTHLLSTDAEQAGVVNEFYAHHGNLSKEIREEAEQALKSSNPATVICTNTLELGIDIGDIASVSQIEPPPSVASLRQRTGRSGRRPGAPQVLRAFTIEEALNGNNHIFAQLRENTFQMCATVMLMLEGWCEPPRVNGMHLSTLVQQLLAVIAECGGILPNIAYNELCVSGPFKAVTDKDFNSLVLSLMRNEIVEQDRSGLLLLGQRGEHLVSHYTFYAAFASETEYRIITGTKTLGTIPLNGSIQTGDIIIFAGKSWRIQNIDDKARAIEVTFFGEGKPPVFTGSGFSLHTMIRGRMKALYASRQEMPFADSTVKEFLEEGRSTFERYGLKKRENFIVESGRGTVLFTWLGDTANQTLRLLFKSEEITAYTGGMGLTIPSKDREEVIALLKKLQKKDFPPLEKLLGKSQNLFVEKWDKTLPRRLLLKNYESLYLARDETREWLDAISLGA